MTDVLHKKKVTIGLDFDGTITADPELWILFVYSALKKGHRVHIVTMRYPTETHKVLDIFKDMGLLIVYTSRLAKKPVCEECGIHIDIWIDDNPRAVNENAIDIWPTNFVQEGQADNPAAYEHDN